MNRTVLLIVFLLALVGCYESRQITEMESELDRLTKEFAALSLENTDRNGDGIQDYFIEIDGNFIYELLDQNFDGRVDESWRYDENDILLSGRVDQDFDGILETQYIYENFALSKILSDSDGNQIFDIFTKLNFGVIEYSEKYYPSGPGQPIPSIGRVEYRYGYPSGPETVEITDISETAFADSRL